MKRIILFSTLLWLPWSWAFAQEGRGTITGRVVDPVGAVIAGAEVRAVSVATGTVAAAKTNESGNYNIPFLLPGAYTLKVEFPGFKKAERPGIEVRVNDVINLEVALQIGSASESIEVTGASPLLESATVSIGQVVDQRRLADLPIQAGNAQELILLAPGVVNTTNLRTRRTSFASAASQIRTDGNALYSNEYTIDGVPNTFASGDTPLVAFQPPQSAVSEFKVQTSAFDAGLGHTPGAVVNLITKGGTNEFHGEFHEWFSNAVLDSSTFFQNRAGESKPAYQDNRYGASVGGPVRLPRVYDGRNKTFFFYAWEANQWGKPMTRVGTVPTDAQKGGDLSGLLALGSSYQIYDPFTTRDAAGGRYARLPLAGNLVPGNRIDPVARNIMKYYTQPNTPGTKEGKNNYTRASKDIFDYYVHFMRFDHNFSEKNRTFLRLDYDHQTEENSDFYANPASGLLLGRVNRGAALDHVMVLSPSSILNLRYGITQNETPEARRSRGFDVASLGYSPALMALIDPRTTTFPNVYINTKGLTTNCKSACTGTFSGFGNFQDGDGLTSSQVHNISSSVNTLKGKHNLRYGADLRLYRAFAIRGGYDVSPGYQFLPTYTKGPNDNSPASATGQDFAAFLLGIPDGQMWRSASYATQDKFFGFYVQDDWKLTKKLTLNLGLRYEYETPVSERFDRAVRGFDAQSASPIEAQAIASYAKNPMPGLPVSDFHVRGGLMFAGPGKHALWDGEKNNFLPRIGLAYQLDAKTVVRTGAGIFYDTNGVNRTKVVQAGFTAITPIIASYDNGLHYVATTASPFPNGLLSPVGATGGLSTYLGQDVSVYRTRRLQPYSQRWAFSIQRLLAGQFLLDAGYVGNKALRLPVDRELNALDTKYLSRLPYRDQPLIDSLSQQFPNPFYGVNSLYSKTISRADLLRPYPQFGSVTETQEIGYSWYHSFQLRGEKRFSHGYTLNVAYTFSKAMEAVNFLNGGDVSLNRGISQYDRPHRLIVSGIYELPFGRGRAFGAAAPRPLQFFIGGWQLNAVVMQQSGGPLSFGDVILYGSLKDIALPGDQRSVDRWFNTSVFERASNKQLASHYRTFPKYLSGVRSDGQNKWDISLIKSFPIRDRVKVHFRAECFDALNHPNFDSPNTTPTGSSFGTVTTQGGLSRQFQFALKVTY